MSRQSQKADTQRKVLDAARQLFRSVGYEASTIRAIAEHAGVSVGSIFNGFTSKSAILSEVMRERLSVLHQELLRITPHLRGSTVDRLRSFFAIHDAFQAAQLRLFLAHLSAAYSLSNDPAAVPFGGNAPLREVLLEAVRGGVQRGDVLSTASIELVVELILAAYAWNYRMATQSGAGSQAMSEALDRQIGLIFEGAGVK